MVAELVGAGDALPFYQEEPAGGGEPGVADDGEPDVAGGVEV